MTASSDAVLPLAYAIGRAGKHGGKNTLHWEQKTTTWGDWVRRKVWQEPPIVAVKDEAVPLVLGLLGDERKPSCEQRAADAKAGKRANGKAVRKPLCHTKGHRHRSKDNVELRSTVVLDVEGTGVTQEWVDDMLAGLDLLDIAYFAHTTWSHLRPGKGVRWRIYIRPCRSLSPDEFRLVVGAVMRAFGGDDWATFFDPRSALPEQFMYEPSLPDEDARTTYQLRIGDGTAGLNVEVLLRQAEELGLDVKESEPDLVDDTPPDTLYQELSATQQGYVDAELASLRQRWATLAADAAGWAEGRKEPLPWNPDGEPVGWEGIATRMAMAYACHGAQPWSGQTDASMGELYEKDLGDLIDGDSCADKWRPDLFQMALRKYGASRVPWPAEFVRLADPASGEPLLAKPEGYKRTQIGMDAFRAYRVAAEHLRGTVIAYGTSGWARWNGKHWDLMVPKDRIGRDVLRALLSIRTAQLEYVQGLVDDGVFKEGDDIVKQVRRTANSCGSNKIVNTTLDMLRKHLHATLEMFDNGEARWLLNCSNGIVDLRTGELRDHDPAVGFTKVTAVRYLPGTSHADWDKVLTALPGEVLPWWQKKCGQALFGFVPTDDITPMLKGGGENGKTTYLMGIKAALGDFYTPVPHKLLGKQGTVGEGPEVMMLKGVRLAVMEELPEGDHLSTSKLKALGSESGLTGRHLYQENVTWTPTHALFMSTNDDVQITATDHGTWRRLAQVDFPFTFGGEDGAGEVRPADPGLRDRVRDDPAVHEVALAWLVAGAVRAHEEGLSRAELPERVAAATERWRLDGNLPARFVDEYLEPADGFAVLTTDVYRIFAGWLKNNGHREMSSKTFWDRAAKSGLMRRRDVSKVRRASSEYLKTLDAERRPVEGLQYILSGVSWVAGALPHD